MDESGRVIAEMTGSWSDLESKYKRDVDQYTELRHGDATSGSTVMVDRDAFFVDTTWK